MKKENKIIKAKNELLKIINKQSKPLYTIRDIIETIKQIESQSEGYTLLNDTSQFFKSLNFKVFEISTYYRIEA